MNVPLLRQIQQYILEDGGRINMKEGLSRYAHVRTIHGHKKRPLCGTVGCLAGNALVLTSGLKPRKGVILFRRILKKFNIPPVSYNPSIGYWGSIEDKARKILGLEFEPSARLFYPSKWPKSFRTLLEKAASGTPEYAQIVSDRVGFFIATGGTDTL